MGVGPGGPPLTEEEEEEEASRTCCWTTTNATTGRYLVRMVRLAVLCWVGWSWCGVVVAVSVISGN